MGNVINFNDFKNKKNEKQNDLRKPISPSNDSYYFFIDDIKIAFAGAFVKSLIENKNKNKEKIISAIKKSDELSKSYLLEQFGSEESNEYKLLIFIIDTQEKMLLEALDNMETQEDLDKMFESNSKYIPIIPMLLITIMSQSYNEFDYRKMERDRFLEISPSLDYLLENQIYVEMSKVNE